MRTDLVTDSERFYNSILDLLYSASEKKEVDELISWWNRYVRGDLLHSCIFMLFQPDILTIPHTPNYHQ